MAKTAKDTLVEKTDFGPGKTPLYYNNNGLFSDPFLEDRLPNLEKYYKHSSTKMLNAFWNVDEFEAVKFNKAFQTIMDLWESLDQDVPKFCDKERQLQNRWIDKIFEALGWTIELEETVSKHGVNNYPDYGLYSNFSDWKKSKDLNGNNKFKKATAVADAKDWGINLDGKGFSNKNPSFQIINYLKQTDKEWGVLTDGRYWRIYSTRSESKHTTYYEIDLIKILAAGDYERFKYFFNFFRVEAFEPQSSLNDRCFLDFVFDDGKFYSQRVKSNLGERVYKVVDTICKGFLEGNKKPSEEELEDVYEYSMYYLFKLMFVLNCESKGLLEVNKQDDYYESSLRKKCFEIKEQFESGKNWSHQPRTYNYINDLFNLLKTGDESIGVHRFGNEPFEVGSDEFYAENNISDEFLNSALLKLACDHDEDKNLQFIDYKILSPDHIGSLFEGLLEYKLKKKGTTFALVSDNVDRKGAGAYYTPDYLVDFIIERTIAPLLKDKKPSDILKLKVLDPAMGSGHFLIGVVKYLENIITNIQDSTKSEKSFIEFDKIKKEVIKNCVYGSDINPLATQLAKFSLWIYSSQKGDELEPLSDQLVCRNTLADKGVKASFVTEGIEFKWKEFDIEKDFCKQVKQFDAIVGNPPWGATLSESTTEILSERYTHSSYKLIDTFKFFIERSFEFQKNNFGRVGFVIPRSILSHIGCRDSRKHCLENGIQEVHDLGDGIFKDVCAPSTVIVMDKSNKAKSLSFFDAKEARDNESLRTTEKVKINYSDIKENPNYEYLFSTVQQLKKFDDVFELGEICDIFDSGLDYSRKKLGDAVFYDADKAKSKKDHVVLRGKNINRFFLTEGRKFLRHNWKNIEQEQKVEDKKTRLKVNKVAYEDREKIFIRQTADQVIAAYDNSQYYNQKSLLSIHRKDKKINFFYILGVLNSPFMTAIYRELVSEEGQAFSQVKKNKLQQLPIVVNRDSYAEKRIAAIAKELTSTNDLEAKKYSKLYAELSDLVEGLYDADIEMAA
ncbi:MAG: N-6 DNA methylase [Halobacteriovoraceae bacterium]|jgi:hypothetical protein|nr:N-6 DNA methylase [Halobacteriovoraceae bacterium]